MRTAIIILAALASLTGCGKEEKEEAVRLSKVLMSQQAGYAKAEAIERQIVDNAKAWCAGIVANGAGKGVELEQNAAVAEGLSKSIAEASAELGLIRQAVNQERLMKEFTQGVRSELITQLTNRQRSLQELRGLLDGVAPQFRQYRADKTYAGDSYPGEMTKLDSMLASYKKPANPVANALEALKQEYKLTGAE